MNEQDRAFHRRLLEMFRVEAQEHVQVLSTGLVDLENAPANADRSEILETVYREAHSLKGAARAVNLKAIETVCQAMESVFDAFKRNRLAVSSALCDLLHHANDAIQELLTRVDEGEDAQMSRVSALVRQLRDALEGKTPSAKPVGASPEDAAPSRETPPPDTEPLPAPPDAESIRPAGREAEPLTPTVRVSTEKLDALFLHAEELLSARLAFEQRCADLRAMQETVAAWKKEWAKIQSILRKPRTNGAGNGAMPSALNDRRLEEFLDWNRHCMQTLDTQIASLSRQSEHDVWTFGVTVHTMVDEMKQTLMLPFSSIMGFFPRFVRDLAREQDKQVDFVVRGDAIEIDRRILEGMKNPLMHLVRNAVHHGIEPVEERRRRNKPARGTLTIAIVQHDGGKVELRVSDDGRGIDTARVKAAAVRRGLLSPDDEEKLSDQDAVALIFLSGVSTSPILTDIAGRGLGMAIVREKVEALTGALSVDTEPGRGTAIRIILPVMLTTFRGVLVREQERLFVAPTGHVERVLRIHAADIKTVENQETIVIDDRRIALARLRAILELPDAGAPQAPTETLTVLILATTTERLAVAVDEVVQEQEVVVKNLGRQLTRVRNIAGATVLGNGAVVPILNVMDVMASAARQRAQGAPSPVPAREMPEPAAKQVLVVEDSITARTLIKNILVTAGYRVETAVDGLDAWTKLHTGSFDLVVSDVDMPRLDGFGLTVKIRGDRQFAELPVVLVTALASREDRERGIDAGANAYIVKSSFDQSNLLDVVKSLV